MLDEFHPPARLLMGPGPSNVDPRVNLAMAKPLLGHLDPYFIQIMHQVQALLREVFATRNSLTSPSPGPERPGWRPPLLTSLNPETRS